VSWKGGPDQRIARIIVWATVRPVRVVNFVAKGHHRGGHAFGDGVQNASLSAGFSWRQRRDFDRRLASQPFRGLEKRHGNMGTGEAVTPDEEVRKSALRMTQDPGRFSADVNIGAGEIAIARD